MLCEDHSGCCVIHSCTGVRSSREIRLESVSDIQVRDDVSETENFLFEKVITETSNSFENGQIFDAANGKFSVFLSSEDTLPLDINKEYYYTIWRKFGNTKEVISSSGNNVQLFSVCIGRCCEDVANLFFENCND